MMSMGHEKSEHAKQVEPGNQIYDSDGQLLGYVSSLTKDGFEAETVGEEETTEEIPGQEFGEGYLMWRCGECGEMGNLAQGMPKSCPGCGASEEAITATRED